MSYESPPWASQSQTYGAEQTRRSVFFPFSSAGGVKGSGDLAVTAPVSGMTVNVAAGEVLVPGSSSSSQGLYYGRVSSTTSLAIAASNPSNPRIDMVCASITDTAYTGATNTFAPVVVTGTPTAGATLVNLNGAPALPTSSIILAYVLVPANATNIVTADIGDQRVRTVVANTASTTSSSTQAFTGNVQTPSLILTGLTGAITQTRLVGGTASGSPATGTFSTNDVVMDATGAIWICTAGGSPGTWKAAALPASATANVATDETTTSLSFTDLATPGPAVTVTTGTKALVVLTAKLMNQTAGSVAEMGFAVSGATTIAASDAQVIYQRSASASYAVGMSAVFVLTTLTAGSNTFTAKYRALISGTADFLDRNISVLNLS